MSCQNRLIGSLGGTCIIGILFYMTLNILTFPPPPHQLLGITAGLLIGIIIVVLTHVLVISKIDPDSNQESRHPRGPASVTSRQIALISVFGLLGGRFFVAVLTPAQLDGFILFISISMTIFMGYAMVYGLSRP